MKLKKYLLLTIAVLAAGCAKETSPVTPEPEPGPTPGPVIESDEISLLTENLSSLDDTKTSISAGELVWTKDDEVTLTGMDASGNIQSARYSVSSTKGTSATFTGTCPKNCAPLFAVYSPEENISLSKAGLTITMPENISGQAGVLSQGYFPSAGLIEGSSSKAYALMQNLFGVLEVTLTSASDIKVKKIVLHDLGGNILWGNCTIPFNSDYSLAVDDAVVTGGDNSISLTLETAVTINKTAQSFYFPVPNGSLDRGYSIVLFEEDSSKSGSIGRAYSFLQNTDADLPLLRSMYTKFTAAATNMAEDYDAKARGFYKTIFVNAGLYLNNKYTSSHIPAIAKVIRNSSDYEYFASHSSSSLTESIIAKEQPYQRGIFAGSTAGTLAFTDNNGVLMYPDGAPRFRVIYNNGGKSYNHGPTMGDVGREAVRNYYLNGGGYTGSCAGSFLSSVNIAGVNHYSNATASKNYTFGIYPGNLSRSHLPNDISEYPSCYTDTEILPAMQQVLNEIDPQHTRFPILAGTKTNTYSKKNSSGNVELIDVRHHGGSYISATDNVEGLERLMDYRYTTTKVSGSDDKNYYRLDNIDNNARFKYDGTGVKIGGGGNSCTWAYKKSQTSGRLVVTGSHPEATDRACDKEYCEFMFVYAMDGNGTPQPKTPDLELGSTRMMDKGTLDNDPQNTKIGDLQYHHFHFTTTSDTEEFSLLLDSAYGADSGINLYLGLRKDGLAYLTDADYTVCSAGGKKSLFIKNLPAGEWYVSVYCATTITSKVTTSLPYYFKYTGHTEVLDGIPYSITLGMK